ncbi:MAG: hypothetical protein HYR93_09635 [Chloroflexi bacterium]|nr:hypothetical protein [Chloroflexota bacterium]
MDRKTPILWFFQIELSLMLLIALFLLSQVPSMQTRLMRMSAEAGGLLNDTPAVWQDMPVSGCSNFGSSSLMCGGFVISYSACKTHPAGTCHVAFPIFYVQVNSRKIVTPPPKI